MSRIFKIITYLVLIVGFVTIGYFNMPNLLSLLQTNVIYQYGYQDIVASTGKGGNPNARVYLRLTAGGTQISPLVNIPTTFMVSVVNEEPTPVQIYATELGISFQNSWTLISPPASDPLLVHTFDAFDFESAEYLPQTDTVIYAGSHVTAPETLPPNSETYLFSFIGTFTSAGIKTFGIESGVIYFNQNSYNSQIPEFDVSGQDISFSVRQSERNLSNDPLGQVNSQDVLELMRNWTGP